MTDIEQTPEELEVTVEPELETKAPKPKAPKAKSEPAAAAAPVDAEPVLEAEVPEPVQTRPATTPPPTEYAVVGLGNTDSVRLSRCIYKNERQRKSLTIHHIQRRLNEWGYNEAYLDKDGYYGDLTRAAVERFQQDQGIPGDGMMTDRTLVALFDGDTNVTVIID